MRRLNSNAVAISVKESPTAILKASYTHLTVFLNVDFSNQVSKKKNRRAILGRCVNCLPLIHAAFTSMIGFLRTFTMMHLRFLRFRKFSRSIVG